VREGGGPRWEWGEGEGGEEDGRGGAVGEGERAGTGDPAGGGM